MKLPYGAIKDDFEKCKKIVEKLTNDNKNSDEITLKIMNMHVSRGNAMLLMRLSQYNKVKEKYRGEER